MKVTKAKSPKSQTFVKSHHVHVASCSSRNVPLWGAMNAGLFRNLGKATVETVATISGDKLGANAKGAKIISLADAKGFAPDESIACWTVGGRGFFRNTSNGRTGSFDLKSPVAEFLTGKGRDMFGIAPVKPVADAKPAKKSVKPAKKSAKK